MKKLMTHSPSAIALAYGAWLLVLGTGVVMDLEGAELSIDGSHKASARICGYEVPKSTSGISYCGGDSFYVVADDGNDTTYELGLHTFSFKFRDDDGSYTMFHRKPSTASEVRAGHVTLEKTFDLEACAYDPGSGNVWAANEAGSGSAAANTIREYNPKTGKIVSELTVPNVIRQNARGNFGLEALTVSGDGLTLWTCNEEALACDGNRSSASESTTVRLVKFTRTTTSDAFQLAAMYGYTVPKWEHSSGGMAASSQRNGVSGLCALPDGTLLVLERELSNDYFVNRICIADVRAATDVKDFAALKGTTWTGAVRTVLKHFWSGGGDVNLLSRTAYNYEGICLGPREPNGNHLLMLIADAGDGYTSPWIRAEHLHGLDSRTLAFVRPPVGTATCVGQNFRLDATKPFTMTVTGLGAAKLRWRLPNHTPSSGLVTAANPSFSFTPSADDTLTWEVAGEGEPEAHEHDWGAGSVTTQPTCGDSGVRTYTCACGETKTEPIAATGNHTFVNGVCTTCRTPDPNYVPPSTATTYYLVGSDAASASSFAKSSSSSVGWATRQNGSVIPTHTVSINYDYVIPDGNVMRLPTATGALTFAGKSLTIVRNGGILLKGTHDTVSFGQLTCDGGAITAGDANKSTRISGPMTILDGTTLGFTVLRPDSTSDTTVTIDELKGTGTLRLKASADTAASKTQTLVLTEAGDFQGTVNAASCSTDKKFVLQVKGGFGGAIASLPKGTSKVVFDYQRLDRDFGVRVAALDAGDVAVTAPPEGFTSGLVFTDVPDPTADDLPLVTFPATVTVDPTAFTVKYAAGASGTATEFSNLAAIRHGDGTTTLVANHVTAPPPPAKGFARANAENRPARVLVIGNSFTQGISRAPRKDGEKLVETRTHFPTAVRAMGERIDYCALYRGGSTIQQHYENRATKGFFAEINWSFDSGAPSWANGAKDGQFVCDEDSTTCDNSESPTAPSATTPFHLSLDDLLAAVDWDVIVIQESSSIAQFPAGTPESLWTGVNAANEARRDYGRGTPRYAFGNICEYVAYLKGARPGAELWIHQTWAHEKDSRQVVLGTMAKCDAMYNAVNASVASVAASYGLKVIPTGYAVQRYRHELPVTAKTQDPCSFDSRHINGGDYLYGESRIPADQLYRTYLQIMTWCQRFCGGMPPAGLAGVANVVTKTDAQRSNASYVELNGAPWFEPSDANEKTVMRACAAAAGALETYPDMEIAEEPDPSVLATYYFVGGDAAGKSSFAGSTAGAASGWATSVGGAVVAHTVSAGNAYVVPNALSIRAAESPQGQTFNGDRLILRTGNLYSKKSVNLTIPELAVETAGTICFGAGNLTIKILDGDITVPEDATLHLKMLFDETTSASALELRSRLVGAGLIRICDATNDQAPSGTQTLLIAEADEYTGSIYAKDEPYAQRFVLKVTGGFGGTIESLPNGTEKVVFNLAGLDPSVGVRVSDDANGVPAGFASGLVFFGVANPSAADLPLVTFPAGMAIDPTAFTVGYATGADAAATPFATLGAVANADGTTTLVANPTTPVDPPDDPQPREMDPIGVCSWSWHEPMTNIIRRMEANGFKGIQLALSPWVWEGEGSAAQKETFGDQEGEEVFNLISNKFAKGELDIHATMICFSNEDYTTEHTISNTCGFYYGLAPSATEEQKELAALTWEIRSNQFAKAVERTRALGVRNITAHIGLSEYDDANMSRLYWACKTCRENGCKLLVETGMYSAERTVAALKRFTELHPDAEIGLNFDTANQVLYGADNPTNAYAVMKGWIEQVHIKDCVETYSARGSWATDVEWGRGDVSRTYDMISVLKADGFTGPMLVEHESGSSDPDVREREILTAVKAIRGESAPVAVGPGEVLGPYLTAEAAAKAVQGAEFTPSAEVAAVFGADAEAKAAYCAKFGFAVVPTSGGQWAVVAGLKPEAWSNVVESAQAATRQIPVADLAALELGVPTDVTVEGCVPGFYYTIYGGSAVTNLKAFVSEKSRNVLCEPNKPVTFSEVVKPSDAAGFFSIGARAAPGVTDGSVADCRATTSNLQVVVGGLYLKGGAEDRIVEIRGIDTRIIGNTAGELSDAW